MSDPQNTGGDRPGDGAANNPWAQPYGQNPYPGQQPGQVPGYGPPAYGQQPPQGSPDQGQGQYGQPQYGQPQYGSGPQYGAPPQPGQQGSAPGGYGAPNYGNQDYGNQNYGAQPGAAPVYGQPQYGQPQYGPGGTTASQQPGVSPQGQDQFASMNRPMRDRRPVQIAVVAGVIAVVAVALGVTAFVTPGFAVTKQLSQSAAESGVKSILEKDYSATEVSSVSCPSGTDIEKGATFTCTASVAGADQKVTVTFLDDDGTYEVGRPSAN